MDECMYRLGVLSRRGGGLTILECANTNTSGRCVATEPDRIATNGADVHVCEGCQWKAVYKEPVPVSNRDKANFCYFTGSNRHQDIAITQTMVWSARTAGVKEEFHFFGLGQAHGAGFTRMSQWRDWKNHFTKIELLKELHDERPDFDYYVWLDSDSFFVRDPGDLTNLIRGNKCWVSLESELTGKENKEHGWQHIEKGHLASWMREFGCGPKIWNTNGGMWIVTREAVDEFVSLATELRAKFEEKGIANPADELLLAVIAQVMVPNPLLNQWKFHKDYWACDWMGTYTDRLPDGKSFRYTDWLTKQQVGRVNPAIVHAMRSKRAMASFRAPLPCIHRGPQVREDVSNLCGAKGNQIAIYSCDLHGECSAGRYCQKQTVKACITCRERSVS